MTFQQEQHRLALVRLPHAGLGERRDFRRLYQRGSLTGSWVDVRNLEAPDFFHKSALWKSPFDSVDFFPTQTSVSPRTKGPNISLMGSQMKLVISLRRLVRPDAAVNISKVENPDS